MYSIWLQKMAPNMDSILSHQMFQKCCSHHSFAAQQVLGHSQCCIQQCFSIHYNGVLKLLCKSEVTDYLLPSGHVQLSNGCSFQSFQLLRKIHMPTSTDHTFTFLVCQTNNVSLSLSCPYPRVTLHKFTQSMTGVINLAAETQSVVCSSQHPVRTGTRRVWRLPDSSFMETCCLEDLFRSRTQTSPNTSCMDLVDSSDPLKLSKFTLDSGHSSVHKSRNQNTDCKKAAAGLANSRL